jgi:hypothetical protein
MEYRNFHALVLRSMPRLNAREWLRTSKSAGIMLNWSGLIYIMESSRTDA